MHAMWGGVDGVRWMMGRVRSEDMPCPHSADGEKAGKQDTDLAEPMHPRLCLCDEPRVPVELCEDDARCGLHLEPHAARRGAHDRHHHFFFFFLFFFFFFLLLLAVAVVTVVADLGLKLHPVFVFVLVRV